MKLTSDESLSAQATKLMAANTSAVSAAICAPRVTSPGRHPGDGGTDQHRDGRRRADGELARGAEQGVGEAGHQVAVDAVLRRQTGQGCIRERDGNGVGRHRDPGDGVVPQPGAAIAREPFGRREERTPAAGGRGDVAFGLTHGGQCWQISRRRRQGDGPHPRTCSSPCDHRTRDSSTRACRDRDRETRGHFRRDRSWRGPIRSMSRTARPPRSGNGSLDVALPLTPGSCGARTRCGEMRFRRGSNCPWLPPGARHGFPGTAPASTGSPAPRTGVPAPGVRTPPAAGRTAACPYA